MRKVIYEGFLIAILLLVMTSSLQAKFNINAGLGLREIYNDNIFLKRSDREYDFITIISPSIGLEYPSPYMNLNLDYRLDFQFYSKHDELNKAGAIPTLNFKTQLRPFKRIFLDVSDTYRRISVEEKRRITFENLFGEVTDSNTFYISPYVEYPLSQTLLMRVGYRFTDMWYQAENGNNTDTHSAFLAFEKRLFTDFTTTLRYEYTAQRPEKTGDYDSHRGSIAVSYKPTSNIMMKGEYGEGFFDYHVSEDRTISFWNISTDYAISSERNTIIGIAYGISSADSVTEGTYKTSRTNLYLKTGRYFKVGINSYYNIDNYLETDRKDEITGVSFNITKETGRISSSFNGLWEKQKFSPRGEEADRYSIGSQLGLKLSRHINTGIGYTYNTKDSSIEANNLYNNIVWFGMNLTF